MAMHALRPDNEIVALTKAELDSLPEYSLSLPTGTTIGKQWKKNIAVFGAPEWYRGEYVQHPDSDTVGIEWRKIEVTE